ncbi:actin-related protein 8-like [Anneissia japonica]|uniref:actin-related protein 8-like n=1 Tax=Anneissia japonica TaxID=1529436 RepID=UPI0014259F37|nr:actin-related protein 8-like [Anneissia japonica]XP_033102485.1 actin-related protein 8-like [Anneissia japonica]XP_033102494.1 actin-related protein 8-like [Anneissia japonica]XP_033102501.1 actin-related protein 8-like [Anneissia japonica]XP_033102509.1 actin-related protein 8-like [Anneissia japonica]
MEQEESSNEQAPEASEPVFGNNILIIHPGSYWIRIGRATDAYPVSVPHVIARKPKQRESSQNFEDKLIIRHGINHPNSNSQKQHALKMVQQAIWAKKTSSGQRRQNVALSEVTNYNDEVQPQTLDDNSGLTWTPNSEQSEFFIGEEALYLDPNESYHIHWPIRQGRFNLHAGVGGSITAVLQDMETIWSAIIETKLDIPSKDFKNYKVVLLVPDIYCRPHVKELMNLVLTRLGFGAAIIHQESVCALYGSGISSACVVDVGDQKTSISCVEDGLSNRNSRLCMGYGGSDVTRCFTSLLQRAHMPYRECQMEKTMDALLLIELKETFCHLDQDLDGTQLLDFHVRYPNSPTIMYQLKLGDETLQAPMGLFYPQLFGIVGEKMVKTQQRNQGDAEDAHDENYLLQTQQQAAKAKALEKAAAENNNQDGNANTNRSTSPTNHHNDIIQAEAPPPTISRRISTSQSLDKALGVDQAILHSIDCCSSEETKKKMYSCILVVGGGLGLFQGAVDMLQYRIQSKMPPSFRAVVDKVEVICKSKDMDPRLTVWKGGAVLSCLDTAQELWIKQKEWKAMGLKVLRERSPFVW